MVQSKSLHLNNIQGQGKCISIFLKNQKYFLPGIIKKEKLEFQKYFHNNKK